MYGKKKKKKFLACEKKMEKGPSQEKRKVLKTEKKERKKLEARYRT